MYVFNAHFSFEFGGKKCVITKEDFKQQLLNLDIFKYAWVILMITTVDFQ